MQPELVFNNTIVNYSLGKWRLKDSLLVLNFTNINDYSLNSAKVEYMSCSKPPFDSISLDIVVTNKDKKSPGSFVVAFNSVRKVNLSDNKGKISLKLPRNFIDSTIEITKLYYQKQVIQLIRNNNYHYIKIDLSKAGVFGAANYDLPAKVRMNSKYKIDDGHSFLKNILIDNIKKFPQRKYELSKFL